LMGVRLGLRVSHTLFMVMMKAQLKPLIHSSEGVVRLAGLALRVGLA